MRPRAARHSSIQLWRFETNEEKRMIAALLTLTLLVPQGAPAALPDTPQGKRITTYIQAFNTGDEKAFMAMQEAQVKAETLKKRTAQERSRMFKRMRDDFGTLKVTRVVKASDTEIQFQVPNKEGIEATFIFSFDAAAPHQITGIGVEIDRGPGL
jgi:hypothetical protein